MNLAVIVSMHTETRGIGRNHMIPWYLPSDLRFFREVTTAGGVVIMGRKTWESIPLKYRPLQNRLNIVLSNCPIYKQQLPTEVFLARSLPEALSISSNHPNNQETFVIGGESLYREALSSPLCERVLITEVTEAATLDPKLRQKYEEPVFDAFFPELDPELFQMRHVSETYRENDWLLQFTEWTRRI